jgi:hypothetical protein
MIPQSFVEIILKKILNCWYACVSELQKKTLEINILKNSGEALRERRPHPQRFRYKLRDIDLSAGQVIMIRE